VEDAALMFEVMAGLPVHSTLPPQTTLPPRLARPRRFFYDLLQDEVRHGIEGALARLTAAGAPIAETDIPGIELAPGIQLITINSEASQSNGHLLASNPGQLGEDVRLRLEIGQFYLAVDYLKAQQLRKQVRDAMIAAFADAEVMVIPAMPLLAPRAGTSTINVEGRPMHIAPLLTRFTSPINFCGLPALSLPCARAPTGAPINLQIVGRPGADATVLRAARWCEQVFA
jgi:Asp-tRNA(Asn)/Glu-tRNA(Gln) amidotransferase A subunit family amidase